MQGFCGSIPHVADLERRLSEEGRYDEFKAAFEEEYGDPWKNPDRTSTSSKTALLMPLSQWIL